MTVRVALVGCGTVARMTHVPGLRLGGDAEVVVFAGRTLDSAVRARDEWGSGDATTDWAAAVARSDVDAVHVCVPNALHAEVAAAALRAGKHVLVEKPITTALSDADVLLALAGDRLLGVAFDARCSAGLQELRRRVPALGRLTSVEGSLGHGGPQLWAPYATWFREPAQSGGGSLMDLGPHVVDAVRWCASADVAEVSSAELVGDVDEEAGLELRLTDGAVARLRVSWQAERPTSRFAFTGERGELVLEDGELRHDGVPVEVPPVEIHTAAGAFARAVATGTPPAADGRDGRAALAVVLAGYQSARTREPVAVA
ncbi:MAG: Gfo/Idh/MocA family oxidoreductase [Chitinophagaceae bacterium]|nr:MAG: Gfo/Idh/MocA family oxidoreductase [Chitinophagaceae bacterium]